jgi:hypothetical protein
MNDPEQNPDSEERREAEPPPSVTPWQVALSALAAAFGVQSSRNRARDFSHGRATHFIAAGIIFTLLFVLGMVVLVNLVLRSAS